MSHAIDILNNALRGDPGGISFLEQTASLYVLDVATTPGQPKTYGWWVSLNYAVCAHLVILNYWYAEIHLINYNIHIICTGLSK